eukprot:scaffold74728_cov41-Phaeocystis_antarctica.AAC.1
MSYMFYHALAFNQPLSFDTSSVTSMRYMFGVRSSPMPSAPNLQSSPPCTLRAPRSPAASCLPARKSSRTVCPPFDSRQLASAFNQPLSFDTSSVTTMYGMFYVRSSPRALPPICSRALPAPCLHRGRPPPPASQRASRPAPYALLSTLGSTRRR